MRIDVTALRPFLAWARKRGQAGDAGAGDRRRGRRSASPIDCPDRRLALLDGDAVETDSIAIE